MIRRIQKLSVFALIADVFILIGLTYLYYFDFLTLATTGLGKIAMFNSRNFTSFIGTAVFTYEGVGLGKLKAVLQITNRFLHDKGSQPLLSISLHPCSHPNY